MELIPGEHRTLGILIADTSQMQGQLLAEALRRRPDFSVTLCNMDSESILTAVLLAPIDVALMTVQHDMATVRGLHLAHPQIAQILFFDGYGRDEVVSAFRSGARGLFCFSDSDLELLYRCIESVHHGQIWASNQQVEWLVEAVTQVPSLRAVNSYGRKLLTPREEQVVALVADGLGNRDIARELGLSEHTIKKYLFRIFDKLGVSTRVELVLYAFTRGTSRPAEWVPA
jgi:DNA-binding NarL/FixJ family response regulator